MKRSITFLPVCLLCITWFLCRRNPSGFQPASGTGSRIAILSHRDYGCEERSGTTKRMNGRTGLKDFTIRGDTLTLTFGIEYHCCANFQDTVQVAFDGVEITSLDVSDTVCRCICNYFKDFAFSVPGMDRIHVAYTDRKSVV